MNYSKLKGKIIEKYNSQTNFAKELGISRATMSAKLQGKRNWSNREMLKIKELLELKSIDEYFFVL